MTIISIGRNADNKIVINDPTDRVGRHHAEIKIEANGYMTLRDLNSLNGTFIGDSRSPIPKDQSVRISRGDKIVFAGSHLLDWNQVPTPPDFSKYAHVVSIGRERDNDISLPGDRISRYHAVVLVDKAGKCFIYDQSSTGTLVNGNRIAPNVILPVKRGDNVMYGGEQRLDWEKVPATRNLRRNGLIIGVLALFFSLITMAYFYYIDKEQCGWDKTIESRRKCVGMIVHSFKFRYSLFNNPDREIGTVYRYVDGKGSIEYELVEDGQRPEKRGASETFTITGSGFFVNKEQAVTNRHVIMPFDDIKAEINKQIDFNLLEEVYLTNGRITTEDASAVKSIASLITIKPVTIEIGIVPDNMAPSTMLKFINKDAQWVSDSDVEDFGILTLEKPIPATYDYFRREDIVTEEDYMGLGESKELRLIGYPNPFSNYAPFEGEITAKTPSGKIQDKPKRYELSYGITSTGGASGSPIIDECGRLVAINYAHNHASETYGKGVPAYLLWRVWDKFIYPEQGKVKE